MISSIFSSSPLYADLRRRPKTYFLAALRLSLFCGVVFIVDRAGDAVLQHGLRSYYRLDEACPIVCLGHSRTVLGIDAGLLEQRVHRPVAKYAVAGANIRDRQAMLRHYLASAKTPLELVVYDVSGYTFDDGGLSSNSYELFLPFLSEPEIGTHAACGCPSRLRLGLCHMMRLTRYNETTLALAARGMLDVRANFKQSRADLQAVMQRIEKGRVQRHRVQPGGLAAFRDTVELLGANQVTMVLVYLPSMDLLNDVDRPAHDAILDIFRSFATRHPHVVFLDYNHLLEHRHELFADGIHLNRDGQQIVTEMLAIDLQTLLHSPQFAGTESPLRIHLDGDWKN